MIKNKILVGTTKGLVVIENRGKGWRIEKVHFSGLPVTIVYVDERTNNWWAGLAHRHWGQKLHYSEDEGKNWVEIAPPKYPQNAEIKPGKPATLKKIWSINHAGSDKPGAMWLGTEPGGLFYSSGTGKDFQLVESLWSHPSRKDEMQWFGAGRDFPFLHSIVVDPRDSDHVYIAVSCAGVFETNDGGSSWEPKNNGLIATYLPNPSVEVGHDPHLLIACKANPDVLWQQNHCGVFRSENGGEFWENVTDKNGLAEYGFALAIDHENAERAWVIPAMSDKQRVPVDLALCVCRTEDSGKTWEALRKGLPQEFCFDIAFRHSIDINNEKLVFGTTTGNLYFSEDFGNNWTTLSNNLSRIDCVVFA